MYNHSSSVCCIHGKFKKKFKSVYLKKKKSYTEYRYNSVFQKRRQKLDLDEKLNISKIIIGHWKKSYFKNVIS
jgi:hypothetical protein